MCLAMSHARMVIEFSVKAALHDFLVHWLVLRINSGSFLCHFDMANTTFFLLFKHLDRNVQTLCNLLFTR